MRNLELEAQLARSPEDAAAYTVYGDWLTEHGDPRGELITIALALEADPQNTGMLQRQAALHAEHDAAWLGPLTTKTCSKLLWRRGFLEKVTLGNDRSRRETPPTHDALYAAMRELPAAALVRDLAFGHVNAQRDEPSWERGIAAIAEHGVPDSLRTLAFSTGGYWDISTTSLGDLSPAYPALGRLESLAIRLGHMELGAIVLPALRSFDVWTGGFSRANMSDVLRAHWPRLESLTLRFGGNEEYGAECELADVLPLLHTPLPNLRHLGLGNATFLDELVPHLATSPLLPQLTSLDLSLGTFSNTGARAILERADAFRHVGLNIEESYVSLDLVTELRAVLQQVEARHLSEDTDEEDRYCQIGE